MKNLQQLINRVESILDSPDYENGTVTINGVTNLSRSDLDTILLYANTFASTGAFSGLMEPLGYTKDVLDSYGIKEQFARGLFG